jgi:hypothetical protein
VEKKTVEEFQHYIYGIDYPAGKEEVAATAEDNGAPQNLVRKIREAERDRFDNPQQVLHAVQGSL